MRPDRVLRSWFGFLATLAYFGAVGFSTLATVSAFGALPEAQYHFLIGYHAYLENNYGECAEENYRVVLLESGPVDRAKVYLAFCQFQLGMKQAAAFNIKDVEAYEVAPQEKEMLVVLKKKLAKEIEAQDRVFYTIYPYGGGMLFSPGYSKVTGDFFGLYADVAIHSWKFSAGFENLSFILAPPATNYNQGQLLLGLQKGFLESEYHARGIYIFSPSLENSGILTLGLGMSQFLDIDRETRFLADFYYSAYPNSVLVNLMALQLNVALERVLTKSEDFEVWFKLGSETIYSQSALTRDVVSGFVRQPLYERGFAELNFKSGDATWGGSIGYGSEAFGVRNDGAIIYSAYENHQFSATAYAAYSVTDYLSLRANYAHEQLLVGTSTFTMDTFSGMITFGL
ncbi:MAG: hypothetical protein HYX41_00635 [Bdellovibrio sp.]|nr:hypothetical protein [Bdellovibrio sp.]